MKFDESSLYNIKSCIQGERYSLYDLAIWKNGLAFKKIHFSEAGVPVIKIAELNNGIGSTTAYTQQLFSDDVHLSNGDLLFSWSGNPQTSIDIFKFKLEEGWLNQHIFKVTPNEKLVDRDYFYFMMKNLKPYFTLIATNKQTTGLGHVTLSDIKRMNVVVPSLKVQEEIVSHLKPIDDKIELNNAINNNLEQQAQALFKSWFVDYEPFGGNKPSDWQISTLGEVSDMGAGGDKPHIFSPVKTTDCPFPIYSNGLSNEGLYGYTNAAKIFDESVTVSARGTIGYVCLRHIPYVPIVRLVTLVPHKETLSAKYLYFWLKQLHITGTGTTQQQLTVPAFQKNEILVPTIDTIASFDEIVNSIYQKIWSNQLEIEYLSSIRDTILPRLMSGELDVSDIDL